jgi:hypothetical protein
MYCSIVPFSIHGDTWSISLQTYAGQLVKWPWMEIGRPVRPKESAEVEKGEDQRDNGRSVKQCLTHVLAEAHLPQLGPHRLQLPRRVHGRHIMRRLPTRSPARARQPVHRLSRLQVHAKRESGEAHVHEGCTHLFREGPELLGLHDRGGRRALVASHVAPPTVAVRRVRDELVRARRRLALPVLAEVVEVPVSLAGLDKVPCGLNESAGAVVVLRGGDEFVSYCEGFRAAGWELSRVVAGDRNGPTLFAAAMSAGVSGGGC